MPRRTSTLSQASLSTSVCMTSRAKALRRNKTGSSTRACYRRWRVIIVLVVMRVKSRSCRTATVTVSVVVVCICSNLNVCIVTENCRRVKGVWLCFGGGGYVAPSWPMFSNTNSIRRSALTRATGRLVLTAASECMTSRTTARQSEHINAQNTTKLWTRWSLLATVRRRMKARDTPGGDELCCTDRGELYS